MSAEQRQHLDKMLRDSPLDLGGELVAQRGIFQEMMTAAPLPGDVETSSATVGGVPVVQISIREAPASGVILYFHGGAYAIGTAALAAGLASDIARRAGSRVVSVDYRLAPEHPYPAGIEDAVAAYRGLLDSGVSAADIVFAGESAGGGIVAATLVALTSTDLPQPAAAYVISPWVDLTLTGASLELKAPVDPALTPAGLRLRSREYLGTHDPSLGAISPVFADLTGLPPLLIQVGGNEILLDDSTRLAARAAASDVHVTLEVTPGVPHVFPAFAGLLDEADEALDSAARFIRTYLSSRPRASGLSVESAGTPA
jgi:epsilon-lactone hydrolase